MHPTREHDEAGGRPVIRPTHTARSEWRGPDTIETTARPAFVQARSTPLTDRLSRRVWDGLSSGSLSTYYRLGHERDHRHTS